MKYELKDTIEAMTSKDYKERFIAEFIQTKIRYEKLKNLLNTHNAKDFIAKAKSEEFQDFMKCPIGLLENQLELMNNLLRLYETRAWIEGIDLTPYEW